MRSRKQPTLPVMISCTSQVLHSIGGAASRKPPGKLPRGRIAALRLLCRRQTVKPGLHDGITRNYNRELKRYKSDVRPRTEFGQVYEKRSPRTRGARLPEVLFVASTHSSVPFRK